MDISRKFIPKYIDILEYVNLLKNNDWISNIKIEKNYEYNYEFYLNNYIGEKSYLLKNDFKFFFDTINIEFVKISTFIFKINNLFEKFILDDNNLDNYILLQSKLSKSNMFMYLLFIDYLIKTNKFESFKDRIFLTALVGNKVNNPIGNDLDLTKKYKLLIIDDCSYSGNQIKNRITTIFNDERKTNIRNYIDEIIIISYMSSIAINNLDECKNTFLYRKDKIFY
jgi:hypothetical protein